MTRSSQRRDQRRQRDHDEFVVGAVADLAYSLTCTPSCAITHPRPIEEQLRFVSRVQGFYRIATRDYTIGAYTIPAGARVLLLFGAANRDPRRFDYPDTFDLNRDLSDHVAFGGGIHYCLGTPLTRLEAGRVFCQLLPRVDTLRLDGDYR